MKGSKWKTVEDLDESKECHDWHLNISFPCNKTAILSVLLILQKSPLRVNPDCSHTSETNKEQLDFKVKQNNDH